MQLAESHFMFTLDAFSGDNSLVAIECDRYIYQRYSANRVPLLLKCYSIVVSAECVHWLRYSYGVTLKTIVVHSYQSIAIVSSKRICTEIDTKELRARARWVKGMKRFHGNSFAWRCNLQCRILRSITTLYMLHLYRDKTYARFSHVYMYLLHTPSCAEHSYPFRMHYIRSSYRERAERWRKQLVPSRPLSRSHSHPPRTYFPLA